MAPFTPDAGLSKTAEYAIYLLLGGAFGAALEMGGFANSRKLAAQFYFGDMTVFKVMFTAIITAMSLVFLASGLGLLDFNLIWVPPTFLVPGIVGGLIMGFGFILGGFCPGTSLVAMANLKIDGLFFVLGAGLGVFLFGETVGSFTGFWYSTDMGRFMIPEWLGLSTGVTVLGIIVMAILIFFGAEKLEAMVNHRGKPSVPVRGFRWTPAAAAGITALGVAVLVVGQPDPQQKWDRLATVEQTRLDARDVYIHPGEMVKIAGDHQINLRILDVRDEVEFNLFHLIDSDRVSLDQIAAGGLSHQLLAEPANTAVVLVSNDENRATLAWKLLVAESIPNVYILEGGINEWLDRFEDVGCRDCHASPDVPDAHTAGTLRHSFGAALGSTQPAADPDFLTDQEFEFTPKVKLELRQKASGGCG